MNRDLSIVLGLLLACVGMFAVNRPRMDAVALLVIILLPVTGVLTVGEALAGFADPSVVLIAAMFVVGEALVRTGVAYQVGDLLLAGARGSETRLLVLLMLATATVGSVMSSTGIVAILIPVVLGIAARLRVPPRRLLMPLSFAALISGMQTLVATPPNMVVDSALRHAGERGFSFFSFTPIGVVVLLLGVGYMLVARRWLAPRDRERNEAGGHDGNGQGRPGGGRHPGSRRTLQDLIDEYHLAGRGHSLRVRPESPLVGRTLQDVALRRAHQLNVIGIRRQSRFQAELLPPAAHLELRPGDVLLVDAAAPSDAAQPVPAGASPGARSEASPGARPPSPALPAELAVDVAPLRGSYFTDESREVGMAEVMVPPESELVGKTVRGASFRTRHGLHVVGLRRGRSAFAGAFLEEPLRVGDTLLVIGPWKAIGNLQARGRDFVVLSLPAEIDAAIAATAPAVNRAPLALLSIGVMVALMVSGIVPNVVAALVACMLLGIFGCIDMDAAYDAIHWQSLLVIVGMMPFAVALQKTGGVALAVEGLMRVLGGDIGGGGGAISPRAVLAALFVLTAVTGLFISNTATAILLAPVALGLAARLGMSPRPFAMTVAIAASAAFMTPVSSPVNTLVYGPGGYRFADFVRVGVPFTFIVLGVTVLLVPWLFPLR